MVKPSSLGDIIHTLPAVEAIHRTAPNAKIDWLVNTEWAPLLEGIPFISRVIPFPRREFRGPMGGWRAWKWAGDRLNRSRYDLALDFQGLCRSALLARSAKPKHLAGFRQAREGAPFLYDQKFPVFNWSGRHAVDRNLDLASAVGANIANPTFCLPPGDEIPGLNLSGEQTVLLHPFSRGEGKSLSVDEVLELAKLLRPHTVVLVGTPPEDVPIQWPPFVVDLLGKTTLPQLIHLIRRCSWTVSVDSGPMHLAAGITDRVLSLHTWSNPSMVGPWQPDAWIWREGQLLQVKQLSPDQFPERRDLKASFGSKDRLFSPEEIKAMSDFLIKQLHS